MTDVEKKVDMSLDELVAMRQKEAKKKAKKPAKKTVRGAAKTASKKGKPTRKAVAQAASKMNRQQKMNARRGIGGPKLSQNEIQKRAAKATKKKGAKVTLKGRGAKVKKPAFKPAGKAKAPVQPKSFTIEPNKGDRPVSIKDFVLPKGTKMQISFKKVKPAAKGKAKAPVKKKAVAKRKAPAKKAPTRKAPARKASAKKPAAKKIQVNVGAKKRPQRKKK
jgi:hypothetical protein